MELAPRGLVVLKKLRWRPSFVAERGHLVNVLSHQSQQCRIALDEQAKARPFLAASDVIDPGACCACSSNTLLELLPVQLGMLPVSEEHPTLERHAVQVASKCTV